MNKRKKKNTGIKALIWFLAIILIIGAAGRFVFAPKTAVYSETAIAKGDITTYFSFSGSVEVKNRETVFADKALQIKEIKVEKGQQIKEDDVLMVTTANQKIKAKISGEVAKIHSDLNAQLMPGARLIDIVDYNNLQLSIQVDEYDLSAISLDKEVDITLHALNKSVKGKVVDISKEGIYQGGVTYFNAIVELQEDADIKVGMSAEVKVLNQSLKNIDTLPMSVILFDENNKPYVNIKGDKLIKRASLELGATDGVLVEVKGGISASDAIIVQKESSSSFGSPMRQRNNTATGGN